MNKYLLSVLVFSVIITLSFNKLSAGRAGNSRKDAKQSHHVALKFAKRQSVLPTFSERLPTFSASSQIMAILCIALLISQPVQGSCGLLSGCTTQQEYKRLMCKSVIKNACYGNSDFFPKGFFWQREDVQNDVLSSCVPLPYITCPCAKTLLGSCKNDACRDTIGKVAKEACTKYEL